MSKTKKQADSHEQSQVYDQEFTNLLKNKTDALKVSVDNGDYRDALDQIRELDMMRDQSLYREVGRLTRSLHEAIQNFHIDAHNAEQQAELSKMADASDRLAYVVKMTSQAANRTLDLVEESMPLSGEIRDQARQIGKEWQRFRRREMEPTEFRGLCKRLEQFLDQVAGNADRVSPNLSEILLAQDFQDLTGQVIQKVTTLVREVEENLVKLVVMASNVDRITGIVHDLSTEGEQQPSTDGVGPQIDADREDVVSSQDDVDDLLSSLGF